MKNPQLSLRAGDEVLVRGARWRVTAVRGGEHNQIVSVVGLSAGNAGEDRAFITPFDVFERPRREPRLRVVSLARWRRACRSVIREAMIRNSAASLWTASDARIDLHAYQLEPALAVVRGIASRVLIADEVGLGKTIQCGLIAAELAARGAADRILFVVPSGVREQWARELRERFDVAAVVMDTEEGRRRAALLPVGVNPWATVPIVITSIDYLRRPEVLARVGECRWDLAVIDEAHSVAGGRERRAAADIICGQAGHVVLLTATPHNGDRRSFQSLCELGARGGDSLLIFRRTRKEVGSVTSRRIHRLCVGQSANEQRAFDALEDLSRAVSLETSDGSSAILAVSLLHKRAFSSVYSLAETAARRIAAMDPVSPGQSLQMLLPFAPDGEFEPADAAPLLVEPLLSDARRERVLLARLADAASAAVAGERKLAALERLLRRLAMRAESAIVFTEYRDTLLHVARRVQQPHVVVHGGMSAAERWSAISRFVGGTTRLLLATDAASEGLNLQASCRVVINLELPWSPVRLEQRIGRVDRLGQTRRVHVFHLIGRETGEQHVARRLLDRIRRSSADIATTDPLGAGEIDAIEPATAGFRMINEARDELARLRAVRALGFAADRPVPGSDVLIASCRRRRTRVAAGNRPITVLRETIEDEAGRVTAVRVIGCRAAMAHGGDARRAAARMLGILDSATFDWNAALSPWATASQSAHQAFWTMRLSREQSTAVSLPAEGQFVQAALFDRGIERGLHAAEEKRRVAAQETRERLAAIARATAVHHERARPILLLLP